MIPRVATQIAFLLRRAAAAGGFSFCGLVGIFAIAEFNLAVGTSSIWFPLPVLCVAAAMLALVEQGQRRRSLRSNASQVLVRLIPLVALVATLGLMLSGFDRVVDGSIALRGDSRAASNEFKIAYSFVIGVAAAMIEEAGVRGLFQFRAKEIVGETCAHIGASIVFLALHGFAILEPRTLIFLIAVSLCAGYLASATGTVFVPAIFHGLVNTVIAATVLALRA